MKKLRKIYWFVGFYFFLSIISLSGFAQSTFKLGWNTYKTGFIVHEYVYNYTHTDSAKLFYADSLTSFVTPDSLVVMVIDYPTKDKTVIKRGSYYNTKKQLVRTEEYKDEALQVINEYKYDDKNLLASHTEENKANGNNYKKLFSYSTDKKTGERIVSESSYYNGKIEFYTKTYYDKNNVKVKEIRLNDNNKDVVHIESFFYGDNGKLKQRSIYFPEWKVTKKFDEPDGMEPVKCFRTIPMGTLEKVYLNTRIAFIKKILLRNQAILADHECHNFDYKFTNQSNCEIEVYTTKVNSAKMISFRLKEKL